MTITTPDETIGDRIKRFRGRMTQVELAAKADVGVDTIRKLEQRRRLTTSIPTLHKLARALDVDTSLLIAKGHHLPLEGPDEGVVALRRAVTAVDDLLGDLDDDAMSIVEARQSVEYAWGCYQNGRYDTLAAIVPTALSQLRATAHGATPVDRVAAHELLARLYWVAACTLVHMGQPDAAFFAIREALAKSEKGSDELLHATLRGSVAWQLLVQGRYDEAVRMCASTATGIEPSGDVPPEHLSVFGSLLITGATAAGRGRKTDEALSLLRSAADIADRTGYDRSDYETAFGPSQLVMQTVDVHIVTENYTRALDAARAMPRDAGLPLVAQLRHRTDKAYAHARLGHDGEALNELLVVDRMASNWTRYQTLPRLVVGELLEQHHRRLDSSKLYGLAKRLGVPTT